MKSIGPVRMRIRNSFLLLPPSPASEAIVSLVGRGRKTIFSVWLKTQLIYSSH